MGECFMFGRGKLVTLDPVFANNDWSKIISACQRGSIPDTWAIGDQKAMTIGTDEWLVDIIGFNHDDYADGSGKAPITFQLNSVYGTSTMNASNTNSGGWGSSYMRSTYLPAVKGYMPTEIQNALRKVNKLTSSGNYSTTISTTEDDLFLLAEIEVHGSVRYSVADEGTQYAYYANGGSKIKTKLSGSGVTWWLRSPRTSLNTQFCMTDSTGATNCTTANREFGVSFAFCF